MSHRSQYSIWLPGSLHPSKQTWQIVSSSSAAGAAAARAAAGAAAGAVAAGAVAAGAAAAGASIAWRPVRASCSTQERDLIDRNPNPAAELLHALLSAPPSPRPALRRSAAQLLAAPTPPSAATKCDERRGWTTAATHTYLRYEVVLLVLVGLLRRILRVDLRTVAYGAQSNAAGTVVL